MTTENKQSMETKKEYTISEAANEYKIMNDELTKGFQLFINIYKTKSVNMTDYNTLETLNLEFKELSINQNEVKLHGYYIGSEIIRSIFSDLITQAIELYETDDSDKWKSIRDEGNKIIIKNGIAVSEMLALHKKLFSSLVSINSAGRFYSFKLENSDEVYLSAGSILRNAESITDSQKKVEFIDEHKRKLELLTLNYNENHGDYESDKADIKKLNQAIEILTRPIPVVQVSNSAVNPEEELNKPELTVINELENGKNKEFTTSRQVLVVYYLLNTFDRTAYSQTDRTVVARFIEFLTGKNYDNIYDTLSNPLKGLDNRNKKKFMKDIEYIKNHFSNLGLQSVIEQIKNDIK